MSSYFHSCFHLWESNASPTGTACGSPPPPPTYPDLEPEVKKVELPCRHGHQTGFHSKSCGGACVATRHVVTTHTQPGHPVPTSNHVCHAQCPVRCQHPPTHAKGCTGGTSRAYGTCSTCSPCGPC